jgi:hypothetical protein
MDQILKISKGNKDLEPVLIGDVTDENYKKLLKENSDQKQKIS